MPSLVSLFQTSQQQQPSLFQQKHLSDYDSDTESTSPRILNVWRGKENNQHVGEYSQQASGRVKSLLK